MAAESKSQSIATVERAGDVLNLFARSTTRDLGVTDIASQLGLSKAVVHRILTSLRSRGFIDVNAETRRYRLGPSALAIGLNYLNQIDVRSTARPELEELCRATSETATLSIRTGDTRVYVDQVRPQREIVMTIALGVPYPLHAGSSSKAFLAFMPTDEIDAYISSRDLRALTSQTITDPEALRRELAVVKQRGYSQSLGERQAGAGSLAAPIFDHTGATVAVISICGPLERFRSEVDICLPLLLQAASRISSRLGYGMGTSAR